MNITHTQMKEKVEATKFSDTSSSQPSEIQVSLNYQQRKEKKKKINEKKTPI
jgi:hypothetical protein